MIGNVSFQTWFLSFYINTWVENTISTRKEIDIFPLLILYQKSLQNKKHTLAHAT
jgi:hypothetical protein